LPIQSYFHECISAKRLFPYINSFTALENRLASIPMDFSIDGKWRKILEAIFRSRLRLTLEGWQEMEGLIEKK